MLAVAQLGGFSAPDVRVSMVVLPSFVALPQGVAAVMAFLAREPVVATLLGLLTVTWAVDVVVQESPARPPTLPAVCSSSPSAASWSCSPCRG